MAEKTTPFVVNDRRKFTAEGELRHDAVTPKVEEAPTPAAETPKPHAEPIAFPSPQAAAPAPLEQTPLASEEPEAGLDEESLPPPPSAEQLEQAAHAYAATVDRLDTAIRAADPGADRIPEMSFERFVQSIYMQAIMQLGGATEPNQQPRIDIIGARQTIDMLSILLQKSQGNQSAREETLLKSALFDAQMAFLEVTQALAQRSANRQPGGPVGPAGGPSIVR